MQAATCFAICNVQHATCNIQCGVQHALQRATLLCGVQLTPGEGRPYFLNVRSQETQWVLPDGTPYTVFTEEAC
jgi:hypothetical protein